MEKIYKILELTSTSLESKTVSEEYGYGNKKLYSYLYREIDDTSMSYENHHSMSEGFKTLEEAENFISKNLGDYEEWIIICTYKK